MNAPQVHYHDASLPVESFREEVLRGLGRPRKAIAPKFFYDARGTLLFDAICELREYYLTRTETAILRDCADELARYLVPRCALIELGSGSCQKIRTLLEKLRPLAYLPVDISRDYLLRSAQALADSYPWLEIHAICRDFTRSLRLPASCAEFSRYVAFFPGSSIGNFEPGEARNLLAEVARVVGPGGAMVVGVDLKKDPALLEEAYNDSRGVTAAFNLNLLKRINRELRANFDPSAFRHHAFYNGELGRIEMHLVSTTAQHVTVAGQPFRFAAGESIHTENSYKYTIGEFQLLAATAGFVPRAVWSDPAALFSIHYLEVR